jgi:hypothetical protein
LLVIHSHTPFYHYFLFSMHTLHLACSKFLRMKFLLLIFPALVLLLNYHFAQPSFNASWSLKLQNTKPFSQNSWFWAVHYWIGPCIILGRVTIKSLDNSIARTFQICLLSKFLSTSFRAHRLWSQALEGGMSLVLLCPWE